MIFGLLPAAGKGTRIQPLAFSKELIPLFINKKESCPLDWNISLMQSASANEIHVVINEKKIDIAQHLKTVYGQSVHINYSSSKSLPESIAALYDQEKKVKDDDVVLVALSDVYSEPRNSFNLLMTYLDSNKTTDVCLGLFNSAPSKDFDSVKIIGNKISEIKVKVSPPLSEWFWGMIVFRGKAYRVFSELTAIYKMQQKEGEVLCGEVFSKMMKDGVVIHGFQLPNNKYFDLGVPDRYLQYLKKIIF